MKKSKRILAFITVVLLVCMYGSTLVFAFIDTAFSLKLLAASVALTILLPVLLYACILVYRLANRQEIGSDIHTDDQSDIQ
ncbi:MULTISPECIES: hypothetical protein [Lachnospiraceae]|jgi:hypothetical protein|uniref:Uncharacterized protein n=1 Tax=Faecalicatena acetigenes TaxID=2981790 RepID=A0ABT2TDD5_9FIRM|nr:MULTISPECIES: hypothetical protein [Lachnospiraceae]MCU6748262.1 hypothetical protein [Faecalicatena acetigenes]RGT71666.1 hypothetical protein DWX08_12425 [Ruminococcus sp. AF18-22]SCI34980.1 Uncharacterised protein [uncultured Clostridium sp.]